MPHECQGGLWVFMLIGLWGVLALGDTAAAACPTSPMTAGGPIEKRWMDLGGCTGALGDAISPEQHHLGSGGIYQDFEKGQIVVHPRWAGDPTAKMTNFLMSAHVDGDKIHVFWGATAPYSYDFFNIRWDRDDHDEGIAKQHEHKGGFLGIGSSDPQQMEVKGNKTNGSYDIETKGEDGNSLHGTYIISVEGCEEGGFLGEDVCWAQGWSYPVEVDFRPVTLPPPMAFPLPPSVLTPPSPPYDLPDGPLLGSAETRPIFEEECHNPEDLIESEGGHKGELKTSKALAVLQAIRDPSIKCRNDDNKQFSIAELLSLVNTKIKESKVVSIPGTNVDWFMKVVVGAIVGTVVAGLVALLGSVLAAAFAPGNPKAIGALVVALGAAAGAVIGGLTCDDGDYDMRLVGLIQIAYRFEGLLDYDTNKALLHNLLPVRGGETERRDFLWICDLPTFIPESENHILMTESSRYLTNQLLAAEYKQANKPIPTEFDNDKNGMTDWMLKHLQSFVQNDFYEYNGRPYAREAMQGISNLYEFAGPTVPSNPCWRSNPPDSTQPPIPRGCDVRRGARIVMDYHAARFALGSLGLRRASPYRRQPDQRNYSRLLGRQSDSMTWRYLALSGGGEVFWQQRYGRIPAGLTDSFLTPLLGRYRMPHMIADLMTDTKRSYFQRFYFDRGGYPGVELYYRHANYLISAGGLHDEGRLNDILLFPDMITEDAWALPTTLIPLKEGLDYRHLVRIAGSEDEDGRVNTCIAPDFACGLNPEIPSGIPKECMRREGNWIFLDFNKNSPGCNLDYGYYVVVYEEFCDTDECRSEAGDKPGTFGFFEVTPYRNIEQLVEDVIAANKNWDFRSDKANVYNGASGRIYTFQPMTSGPLKWGMVAVSQGGTVTNFEGDIAKWPLAEGELMRSEGHNGCITIDNPLMDQRLILDYTDANRPKRTRRQLSGISRECRCPLPESCLPPRYE